MQRNLQERRGQAILMVTLALFVLCGMLGLAIDLGWGFYVKKTAQAAADSAALAAAEQAFQIMGPQTSWASACPGTVNCTGAGSPVACPGATGNLANGCAYASQNGFYAGNIPLPNSPQNMTLESGWCGIGSDGLGGSLTCIPTAQGVRAYYWVTARAYQQTPQLFSAVLGNTAGASAARATAAIRNIIYPFQIYGMNRVNDTPVDKKMPTGGDIYVSGGGGIGNNVSISLASSAQDNGKVQGGGTVNAQLTVTPAKQGSITTGGSGTWTGSTLYNQPGDQPYFTDPMSGKGQPPAPSGISTQAVTGGALDCSSGPITPHAYYAVDTKGKPTGAPITFSGGTCTFGTSGAFNQFVFYGGADLGGNTYNFNPGEYVFAGCAAGNCNASGNGGGVFFAKNATLQDLNANSAGELFIFTDGKYTGNLPSDPTISGYAAANLGFGDVTLQSGASTTSNIHGLNTAALPPGSPLDTFAPVVWWEDQRSSPILYDSNGNIVTTGSGCGGTLDSPCTNPIAPKTEPTLTITTQGGTNFGLSGTVYTPRGTGTVVQTGNSHNSVTGGFQLITGSLYMGGSGTINMIPLANPPAGLTLALVE